MVDRSDVNCPGSASTFIVASGHVSIIANIPFWESKTTEHVGFQTKLTNRVIGWPYQESKSTAQVGSDVNIPFWKVNLLSTEIPNKSWPIARLFYLIKKVKLRNTWKSKLTGHEIFLSYCGGESGTYLKAFKNGSKIYGENKEI